LSCGKAFCLRAKFPDRNSVQMATSNPYETAKLVNEYLLFHYGQGEEILPYPDGPTGALDFAERAVTEMFELDRLPAKARALDVGCAVGRSSFTLSRVCEEVIGIDFSHAFVEAAHNLGQAGESPYDRVDEGRLTTSLVARLPEGARPRCVSFEQGDAMALRDDLGTFDAVLLANLICRLPEPNRCLDRLHDLVKPGGQLVITSPYTWLDDFTPPANWLGGFQHVQDGPIVTIDSLQSSLAGKFTLKIRRNLPFLIREHARKFQWSVAEGSLWERCDP